MTNYEKGIQDAIIIVENEIMLRGKRDLSAVYALQSVLDKLRSIQQSKKLQNKTV